MKRILTISILLLAIIFTVNADRRRLLLSRNVAAAAGYSATSTRFTADDYLSHSATLTNGTGTNGMISFWIKSYTSGNNELIFSHSGLDLIFEKTTAGLIHVRLKDFLAPTIIIEMTSTASVEGGAWHHVASTWSTNTQNDCKIYIDGTEGQTVNTFVQSGFAIQYGYTTHYISSATLPMNCDISELWYAPKQRIDLSSNITKFRSAGGAPVGLGSDGSTPTGSKPTLYIKDPFTSLVNLGTGSGGDFTVTTGTLTAGSAIP